MANYRVIIRGAHGRQVYVKNAGSREEAAVKAEAQAGIGIEDIEAVDKTTCDPDYIDSGHRDGHAGPRVLMPSIPWHFCELCGAHGHKAKQCPRKEEISGPAHGILRLKEEQLDHARITLSRRGANLQRFPNLDYVDA